MRGQSTWTPRASQPPYAGVVDGTDDIVSFKTGGPTGKETLISDGDYHGDEDDSEDMNKAFRGHHDHYGPSGNTTRGYYTGPYA